MSPLTMKTGFSASALNASKELVTSAVIAPVIMERQI